MVKGPKQLILEKLKGVFCKKVKVKMVGGPGGNAVKEEWNVLFDGGIWGYGGTEKEAWKDALERLQRVHKL